MDSVNEELFNQAVSYMSKAQTDMDQANSVASGISIPSDFSGASTVETAITGVTSQLKPQVDSYASTFEGLQQNVASYIAMEKNAQTGAASLTTPSVLTGFNGKAAAVLTSNGIIDLSSFSKNETTNGTYYTWGSGKGSGLKNICDIYIPNVSKPEGVMITFAATGTIRAFRNGEIATSSIVIFPNYGNDTYLTDREAKNITEDAKNIAASFGVDQGNISICGFSQGGSLVGSLVAKNDPGTFKTAIFASTRYGYKGVSDPNVKVITLVGSNEENRDNGESTKAAFEEFKATHPNEAEIYIVPEEPEMDAHLNVLPQALKGKQFNGENIFDYASTPGTQTPVTPLPEAAPSPEEAQTTPTPNIPSTPTPTPTPGAGSSESSGGSSGYSGGSSGSSGGSSGYSGGSSSSSGTPAVTPTPTSILPENKFTSSMPELNAGTLNEMEISTQHVKYTVTEITDSDYQTYLNSLSQKGYTLSADGTYWVNGDNRIYVNYLDSNLTINLTNSKYL